MIPLAAMAARTSAGASVRCRVPVRATFSQGRLVSITYALPQVLPKPDNIKNFYASFFFLPKSLLAKRIQKPPKATKPNRSNPLLLAQDLKQLLDDGVVNSKAELARLYGFSRPRITQIMNLLNLPSDVKGEILALSGEKQQLFTERKLREILRINSVRKQMEAFSRIKTNRRKSEASG